MPRRSLIHHTHRRYKACKNAEDIGKAQEIIQAEIHQEVQDRRGSALSCSFVVLLIADQLVPLGDRNDSHTDDLLVANPNHSARAWRPLRRSRKGKLADGTANESDDSEEEEDSSSGADEPSAESDEEEEESDYYDQDDEDLETDALGNTIPRKKPTALAAAPPTSAPTNGETEQESVETTEKGAGQVSTEDRA